MNSTMFRDAATMGTPAERETKDLATLAKMEPISAFVTLPTTLALLTLFPDSRYLYDYTIRTNPRSCKRSLPGAALTGRVRHGLTVRRGARPWFSPLPVVA